MIAVMELSFESGLSNSEHLIATSCGIPKSLHISPSLNQKYSAYWPNCQDVVKWLTWRHRHEAPCRLLCSSVMPSKEMTFSLDSLRYLLTYFKLQTKKTPDNTGRDLEKMEKRNPFLVSFHYQFHLTYFSSFVVCFSKKPHIIKISKLLTWIY